MGTGVPRASVHSHKEGAGVQSGALAGPSLNGVAQHGAETMMVA